MKQEEDPTGLIKELDYNSILKRSKIVILIITAAVVLIAAFVLINRKSQVNKQLSELAEEYNKKCPLMVDEVTRLDSTSALSNHEFQFCYTMIVLEKQMADTVAMKNFIMPNAINYVKTNPEMNSLRDDEGKVSYLYRDKNGDYLCKFTVTPEQYK